MTIRYKAGDPRGVPSGYEGNAPPDEVRVPSCGIEDLDKAFFKTLRDGVAFQVSNDPGKQQKVPIVFAVGEKWSMIKSGRAVRDKDGTLILPLITVRRSGIEQTSADVNGRGMNQHVGQMTVRTQLDPRDRAYQNILNKLGLVNSEDVAGDRDFDETGSLLTDRTNVQANALDNDVRDGGLLAPKLGVNAWQIVTLPTPQFYTATYEITIWAQYVHHMNQMLEKLMSSYLPTGNRTMRLDTDKGYWFVAYFDEGVSSEDNVDNSSGEELVRKYKLTVKVPAYLVESGAPGMPSGLRKFVSAPQIAFATGGEGVDTFLTDGIATTTDDEIAADDPDRMFLLTDPSQHPQTRVNQAEPSSAVQFVMNPFTGRREPRYTRVLSRNSRTGETSYVPTTGFQMMISSGNSSLSTQSSNPVSQTEESEQLYSYEWDTRTTSATWVERDGAMLVHFQDKWWMLGGWNPNDVTFPAHPLSTTNEVWKSLDLQTWTLELAHDTNPPTSGASARWKRRHWFGCFKHTHNGTEYIYVLGGDNASSSDGDFSAAPSNGYQCDVWRSANGTTWERVAASGTPTWSGRMGAVFGSSPGKLWCFGGQNGLLSELAGSCVLHNDLHVSTDGGASWTEILADAAASSTRPSPRGFINQLVYWNSRMWLVSGGTYETAANANRQYFREVWSFDPGNPSAGWTEHATAPFAGVEYANVEVYRDRLWLISGYSGDGYVAGGSSGQNTRLVWSSGDGEIWRREETPPWEHTHAAGTAVSSDGEELGIVAGNGGIAVGVSDAYALVSTPLVEATIDLADTIGIWSVGDAVLDGTNIVSIPDSSGAGGPDLVYANVLGDATYNASDSDFGGAASAQSNGGFFLKTASAIDLSTFTIFIVGKFERTVGSFYTFYALTTGPVQYAYDFMGKSSSTNDDRIDRSFDVRRGGVSTAGSAISMFDNDEIRNIYAMVYDGTAAGTQSRIEAKVIPDSSAVTGNAGTSAWSATLHILSDNGGTGSKAGKVAEVRVYRALTAEQILSVEEELRQAYPYTLP